MKALDVLSSLTSQDSVLMQPFGRRSRKREWSQTFHRILFSWIVSKRPRARVPWVECFITGDPNPNLGAKIERNWPISSRRLWEKIDLFHVVHYISHVFRYPVNGSWKWDVKLFNKLKTLMTDQNFICLDVWKRKTFNQYWAVLFKFMVSKWQYTASYLKASQVLKP